MKSHRLTAMLALGCAIIFWGLMSSAQAVTYVYDDLNRLTEVHFEDSTWIKYTYDEVGNRAERTYHDEFFPITVISGTGGTVSPSSESVIYGGSKTFTITPNTNYHIADVLVDGSSVGAGTSYTFSNVTSAHTIQAGFAIDTFQITTTVNGGHGSITPPSPMVNYGGSQRFIITPDAGYHVVDVLVDGSSVGAGTSYTFSNVTSAHTIQAGFAIDTFQITTTVNGGHGSITPPSPTVNHGESQSFTITPDTGYHVVNVLVDGNSMGAVISYTFNHVTAVHTIQASFAIDIYSITGAVDGGGGGSISPTSVNVNYGGNQVFTITPDTHYYITDVKIDGISNGPITGYTFTNVSADHTISAGFALAPVINSRTDAAYTSLQAAYNAALDSDTIKIRDVQLTESFIGNRNISLIIDGGYQSDFISNPNMTTIVGAPIISSGAVTLKNFHITY